MIERPASAEPDWLVTPMLGDALARGAAQRIRLGPVLEHLLTARDQSLFSDAIVARVRGMLIDLAWQLLRIQAEATGERASEEFAGRHGEALAEQLFAVPELVSHAHALAIEAQLALALERRSGIDPVLTPLIQDLVGNEDPQIAQAAMAVLAAQTRFVRSQRRMELALRELGADLFHAVLTCWRAFRHAGSSDAMARAEARLRKDFDEGVGRLAQLDRLVGMLPGSSISALSVQQAGVALFLSALATRTDEPRDSVAVSTDRGQMARLALSLRAAGLKPAEIENQLLAIDPEAPHFADLDQLGTREAADLLKSGGATNRRAFGDRP